MEENTMDKVNTYEKLVLTLYISGMSPKSMEAIENLKFLCDTYLKDSFELEPII